MSQITTGLRSVLSQPCIYDMLQNLMGAKRARRDFVDKYIGPSAQCNILDIGCGTGEILAFLPETVRYWGFDISTEYIEAAKSRFGSRGNFYCGYLNEAVLNSLPKFDVVLAIGVLHHLDDDVAANLIALAHEALIEGGRLITVDPCLAAGQNPIARCLIRRDRGQNVREAPAYRALVPESFSQVSGILRHRTWIPYTHWIMECLR